MNKNYCWRSIKQRRWFGLVLVRLFFNLTNNRTWFFCRTTIIPLPFLTSRLKNWLRQDWDSGIGNGESIIQYTLQFIPVVRALNRVLAEMPSEQIIYRVNSLTKVFDFAVGWAKRLKRQDFLTTTPRLNTPSRATAAGFWYLHEKQPDKATEAFEKVRSEARNTKHCQSSETKIRANALSVRLIALIRRRSLYFSQNFSDLLSCKRIRQQYSNAYSSQFCELLIFI